MHLLLQNLSPEHFFELAKFLACVRSQVTVLGKLPVDFLQQIIDVIFLDLLDERNMRSKCIDRPVDSVIGTLSSTHDESVGYFQMEDVLPLLFCIFQLTFLVSPLCFTVLFLLPQMLVIVSALALNHAMFLISVKTIPAQEYPVVRCPCQSVMQLFGDLCHFLDELCMCRRFFSKTPHQLFLDSVVLFHAFSDTLIT